MVKKVLVVDDSVLYRSQIKAMIDTLDGAEVIDSAKNGEIALEMEASLKPDLMILDLEMPKMNGIEVLKELANRRSGCNVIVFSATTAAGIKRTFDALSQGAVDFIEKPSGKAAGVGGAVEKMRSDLLPKVRAVLGMGGGGFVASTATSSSAVASPSTAAAPNLAPPGPNRVDIENFTPAIVVIAASTGGPPALEKVFGDLHGPRRCPILLAQHMPAGFTKSFGERLSRKGDLVYREAENGELLRNDTIYIAPGNFHMSLFSNEKGTSIKLTQGPLRNSVRPCANFLFESAAEIYGGRTMGFVFTGMGEDGLDGAKSVKSRGGGMMIQDQESSVVWGMPGAVFGVGAYDKVGDLNECGRILQKLTKLG